MIQESYVDLIRKDTLIEDLVCEFPKSVGYMMEKGIKCIACGEPIWGTLESAAREKGFLDEEIDEITRELHAMVTAQLER